MRPVYTSDRTDGFVDISLGDKPKQRCNASTSDLLPEDTTAYVQEQIHSINDELFKVQHAIWSNPELNYQEHFAHDTLTAYMEKQPGWKVTKHAYGMDTAFACEFSYKATKSTAVVSFNSEFDALPGIGHACGHNLIAICGVAGALSTAMAMTKFGIPGTVKLYGTPAEEGGGGKIKFIEAGAYDDCDVSLIGHGSNVAANGIALTTAILNFNLEYFGKEAHAAAAPWMGVNALDAMVIMYNSMAVLRQQLQSTDIVQMYISNGGSAPNIISGHTSASVSVRAPTLARMRELEVKVMNCIKAGALATGCKFKTEQSMLYYNHIPNDVLADRYKAYMNDIFGNEIPDVKEQRLQGYVGASTDQGNVSWVVPSLHPSFHVESKNAIAPHSKDFTKAAGTPEAHTSAIETGMSLAFTALELLQKPDLLKSVKEQWEKDMKEARAALETVQTESLVQAASALELDE